MSLLTTLAQTPSKEATEHSTPISPEAFAALYTGVEHIFASPCATFIAADAVPLVLDPHRSLSQQVTAALQAAQHAGAGPAPVVLGALPFDQGGVAALGVSSRYQRWAPLARAGAVAPADTGQPAVFLESAGDTQIVSRRAWPDASVYEAAVDTALERFHPDTLSKVVLSRTLEVTADKPLDRAQLLHRLLVKNPHGLTYAVPLTESDAQGTPGVFIGASPELLVRRIGNRVFLNPLAGSAPRRHDAEHDVQTGQALLASRKDLAEHAIVIDAIVAVLRPLCKRLDVPSGPSLTATDALWHLSTVIEGELADAATTALDLAYALHPTPAVCGHPLRAAQQAIAELEPFDRGLFAGFVGWMDAQGDGEWAVTLRCAKLVGAHAVLYAGAGIVPGSVPALETAETQTKFRTMLSAMGLDTTLARA